MKERICPNCLRVGKEGQQLRVVKAFTTDSMARFPEGMIGTVQAESAGLRGDGFLHLGLVHATEQVSALLCYRPQAFRKEGQINVK
jgi:hypothetical protein